VIQISANKLFFLIVGIIQLGIALLNYFIAFRHTCEKAYVPAMTDILCGISWTLCAGYKYFEFTLAT